MTNHTERFAVIDGSAKASNLHSLGAAVRVATISLHPTEADALSQRNYLAATFPSGTFCVVDQLTLEVVL